MCFELGLVAGFLARRIAPTLSSLTKVHLTSRSGIIKLQIYRKKIVPLISAVKATYSASVEERVTLFYVLENNDTHAPAHITTPPDTDCRLVFLLAKSESTYNSKSTPLPYLMAFTLVRPLFHPQHNARHPTCCIRPHYFTRSKGRAKPRTAFPLLVLRRHHFPGSKSRCSAPTQVASHHELWSLVLSLLLLLLLPSLLLLLLLLQSCCRQLPLYLACSSLL